MFLCQDQERKDSRIRELRARVALLEGELEGPGVEGVEGED
jgi:hypothetical protein